MKDYIHKGSQKLEFPGQCVVLPSLEGTPFSAELDPDQERSLIALGAIALAEPLAEDEPSTARKGRR